MTKTQNAAEEIVAKLNSIDIDGETMEYIVKRVGLEDQLLRQLFLKACPWDVDGLIEERKEVEKNLVKRLVL